jgi:hypothetical protein
MKRKTIILLELKKGNASSRETVSVTGTLKPGNTRVV